MNKSTPRVIIVHPDRQHSLQTAKYLQENGYLYKYYTTVYLKKYSISKILYYLAPKSIRRKFDKHYLDTLDDNKIHLKCEFQMLLLSLIAPFIGNKTYESRRKQIIESFNKRVLNDCLKDDFDCLISFDTLSSDCFLPLKEKGVKIVLDMSAPCLLSMVDHFKEDIDRFPSTSHALNEYLDSEKLKWTLSNCKKELTTYDFFFAASTYTKDTLMENGVDEKKIILLPYGINVQPQLIKRSHKTFTCIYVGSVTQQKGCHYIFRYAKELPDVRFILIGAYDHSYNEIPSNCELKGYLSFPEIKQYLADSDMFIFLSLSDGFGFAPLEGMSMGLPVISSKYAGIRDFVDGSGWIVSPEDKDRIINIIKEMKSNPSELNYRKEQAFAKANSVVWEEYSERLCHFITSAI